MKATFQGRTFTVFDQIKSSFDHQRPNIYLNRGNVFVIIQRHLTRNILAYIRQVFQSIFFELIKQLYVLICLGKYT